MVLTSSPLQDYRTYRDFSEATETIEQMLLGAEKGVEVEFPNGTLYTFEDATEIFDEVERRRARLLSRIRSFLTGLVGVPLGVLVSGLVISWIVRGFSAQRRSEDIPPH